MADHRRGQGEGRNGVTAALSWPLYASATLAEASYTTAVDRAYGKDAHNARYDYAAHNARYDYARNGSRPCSPLHALYAARIAAIDTWNAEVRRYRAEAA